ncbi:hypothetical protein TELCIR_15375 [Teladorsagia circumcincta]|uniref:Uncharacterized protein n=1 Tax=Teladorsagia circumcincta TaxID=45464 RepID=A0A2G9TYJ4_TELCI|nr:hypothetical protein TELCIR_15375 [Teladorsagia circumcincta]
MTHISYDITAVENSAYLCGDLTIAITLSEITPILMLCASFYVRKATSKPPPHSYTLVGAILMVSKSFNCTVAMILTTTCYRRHFLKMTGLSRILPQAKCAPVAPMTTTTKVSH